MTGVREDLERTTETLHSPSAPIITEPREACLVHIYPTGPNMGRRYPLTEAAVTIGRGSDCDIYLEDNSASRRHARIQPAPGGFVALDLRSTNGTFVNGEAFDRKELKDGDYLRVGQNIFRFLTGGNVEAEYHEEIYRLAIIDALTQIPNKRCLMEFLQRELIRAVRHQRPLSVILFDLDRFKSINDGRGHLCGDYVLTELAASLQTVIRAEEIFARYGGEEFGVVLPETTLAQAVEVAERLRGLAETHPFQFNGETFSVTISLGVATCGADPVSATELLQRADEKLYEAKRGGRNRVAS